MGKSELCVSSDFCNFKVKSLLGLDNLIQRFMPKGYMYILRCADGSYYTGSTRFLERRLKQHQNGEGANHTKKHLPVELVYFEEYPRIDMAFYREKQVQGWNRRKKEALIAGEEDLLPDLSLAYRDLGGGFESLSRPTQFPKAADTNDPDG